MLEIIVTAIVSLLIAIPVTAKISVGRYKKDVEAKVGNAEEKARSIIDDALKNAESKKRESLLEIKEETIKAKSELDKEIKERRNDIHFGKDSHQECKEVEGRRL